MACLAETHLVEVDGELNAEGQSHTNTPQSIAN